MSLAEIEQAVGKLTPEEQDELSSYLDLLRRARRPDFRKKLGDAMRRMDAGEFATEEEVRTSHERLLREGR